MRTLARLLASGSLLADGYLFAVTPWVERTEVNIGHLKNLWAFLDRDAAPCRAGRSAR